MDDRSEAQGNEITYSKLGSAEAFFVFRGSRMMSSTADAGQESGATLQSLPTELLVEIVSMLSIRDVIAFGFTCHRFHQLTLIHCTWQRLFRRQSRDWRLRNIKPILKCSRPLPQRRRM